MSEVRVSQPHSVSVDEARRKIEDFEAMIGKYGVSAVWAGNQATLKGTGVGGTINIQTRSVDVVVKLGLMARAVGVDAVRLEASIRKRLKAAFEGA